MICVRLVVTLYALLVVVLLLIEDEHFIGILLVPHRVNHDRDRGEKQVEHLIDEGVVKSLSAEPIHPAEPGRVERGS